MQVPHAQLLGGARQRASSACDGGEAAAAAVSEETPQDARLLVERALKRLASSSGATRRAWLPVCLLLCAQHGFAGEPVEPGIRGCSGMALQLNQGSCSGLQLGCRQFRGCRGCR